MNKKPVLVVGGGAAGMTAARAITAAGGEVILIANAIGGGSSPWAQGGVAAAVGSDDSPALHYTDTLDCGGALVDEQAARVLTDEAPARLADLVTAGVPFDREPDGSLSLGLEGGHHRRRIIHAGGGATGWHIIQTLAQRVLGDPAITVIESAAVTDLVGSPDGVTGLRLRRNGAEERLAGAVILATGGCAGLFGRSTNPATVNGSGIGLAWRVGAAVADLEFVQFHPTALDLPAPDLGGRALLLTEALRGEGAYLFDSAGRRFLLDGPLSHPLAELAPRDEVARAIVRARRSGPVHLSLRHVDADRIRRRFPNLVALLQPLGLDLATDLLPIAPAAHYVMGGVVSDLNGATTVPGLFVAGEVACTGVQGANRLASNSLLECLVFGNRAGQAALTGRKPADLTTAPGIRLYQEVPVPPTGDPVPDGLGTILDQKLGVERDAAGISDALSVIPETEAGLIARRLAIGAWLRQESRGAHYRLDYPEQSASWHGRIIQVRDEAPRFVQLDALADALHGVQTRGGVR